MQDQMPHEIACVNSFNIIKETSNLTHYLQNSRQSARKYTFYYTLAAFECQCCQLNEMEGEAKILVTGVSVQLLIYVRKDVFN